jgi:hypothetical protein
MALRIAFDLDGVLADMESELVRQSAIALAAQPLDDAAAPNDAGDASDPADPAPDFAPPAVQLNTTRRQQRELWRHVRSIENFWEQLDEIETGVVRQLAALAAERRWEIIFLTKRPDTAGATAQVQTQRWLEDKGFRLPSVFVVQGSRGRIAASLALDFVVDDRLENCLDVVTDSKARAILIWRPVPNKPPATAKRLGIGVVKSVADCLEILTQFDASAHDDPGVVRRLRRLLGLKASSS